MNNDMNNNLDCTNNFKLLINCKKTLNIIEYVSLAFYVPTLLYYILLALENSRVYGPIVFKTLIQVIFLYFLLETIKRGHKISAVFLLLCSLVSCFFLSKLFKLAISDPLILFMALFQLCNILWMFGSMVYVLFSSDIKAYYDYINSNNNN